MSGCLRTNRHYVLSQETARCKHQTGYYTLTVQQTILLQSGDKAQSVFSANVPSRLMLSQIYATCYILHNERLLFFELQAS